MASHGYRRKAGKKIQQWKERPKQEMQNVVVEKGASSGDAGDSISSSLDANISHNSEASSANGSFSSSAADGTRELSASASGQKTMWIPKTQGFSSPGMSTVASRAAPDENTEEERENAMMDGRKKTTGKIKGVRGVYAQAHLRATFYPKFENEKSDQEVRLKMIEVVDSGKGVLEVSLKHSGSLFMYAGDHGGAFAKNSFGNFYTAVGVFVLGRTLQEAWGNQSAEKQRQFNEFLEKHRMCVAMELVTAVLGDHGQRPLKDYVVVTAVAELEGKPRFYSTPDLLAFCCQWRLPTNHVWLFSSRMTASSFFAAYDALCEEGTASSVSKALDEIADISVPATMSHMEYQGEILEGLVARVVSPHSIKRVKSLLQQFSTAMSHDQVHFGPSLREIIAANRANEKQKVNELLEIVGPHMCSDWSDWMCTHKGQPSATSLFDKFLTATPVDDMTEKLQEMIRVLREQRMAVRYPCRPKSCEEDGKIEFKLTIHVLWDNVFQKYQREMRNRPGLWPLYRGFFVDISLFDDHVLALGNTAVSKTSPLLDKSQKALNQTRIEDDSLANEAENMMLKLKFLTYKLRTFLIRNGLSILFDRGYTAYKQYYFRQMEIWGTSTEKKLELNQLLTEWATYITKKCRGIKLKGDTYLSEAEQFLEEYACRNEKNRQLIGAAGTLVRTEDFLPVYEVGRHDEEEELVHPNVQFPKAHSLIPEAHVHIESTRKSKGLLVFFPGIPGCGKSAICKEILHSPSGLGDGRPVQCLMGDLIKGKYWHFLEEDRRRQPSVVTLADKNAPNEEVWKQIERICSNTSAVGVPVVPSCKGTSSNPFSLDTLAVFIHRVLQRINHPGNLDKNSPNPGYVLLMFYNLYEGKDRSEFEENLRQRFGYLVEIPVLRPDRSAMPQPVTNTLMQGLVLFKRHTAKHGKLASTKGAFQEEWAIWERHLREILFSNSEYLNAFQVPFEETAQNVCEQLQAIAQGHVSMHIPLEGERTFRTITFAAISFPPNDIVELIKKVSHLNEVVSVFFSGKAINTMLKEAHVTLAHKRSHGVPAVAAYAALCGLKVPVQLTALLLSEELCAFEAHICSSSDREIISRNEWPHVTVWTAEGIQPKEANRLPDLVTQRKATCIDFPTPFIVLGVVNLV